MIDPDTDETQRRKAYRKVCCILYLIDEYLYLLCSCLFSSTLTKMLMTEKERRKLLKVCTCRFPGL